MLKLKDLNKLKFIVIGYLNWTTIFLVVPSAFLFFANIYLFDYLDDNIYFLFGHIMIFISIQNSIGALAFEQLIIRNSGGEKRITLYFNIIGYSFGAIALTSFILSRVININASFVVLFLVFFTTGLNMTISKVFKLLKKTELTTATTNFCTLPINIGTICVQCVRIIFVKLHLFILINLFISSSHQEKT